MNENRVSKNKFGLTFLLTILFILLLAAGFCIGYRYWMQIVQFINTIHYYLFV